MIKFLLPLLPRSHYILLILFVLIVGLCPSIMASYVFTDITTTSMSSKLGFSITSSSTSPGRIGYSVKSAGDVNKDGLPDLIIGSPGSVPGAVYVVFGSTTGFSNIDVETMNLSALGRGFTITGEFLGDYFGAAVSGAGDVNHDGIDDIVIGAYLGGAKQGASSNLFGALYVVFGRETGLRDIRLSTTDLATTHQGFKIIGPSYVSYFGISVSPARDVNNDTIDDIVIGADLYNTNQGAVYVIFGRNGTASDIDISTTNLASNNMGFKITGLTNSLFGFSVSSGDFNNDGLNDIIIGTHEIASVYIVLGRSSLLFDVSIGSASFPVANLQINGPSGSSFGYSVSNAGDLDGDGFSDMIIGAYSTPSGFGAAYVLFGRSNLAGTINLATTNLAASGLGFRILGEVLGEHFGSPVASAGDFNNDGINDLIIGANTGDKVYVVFGRANSFTDINLATTNLANSRGGFRIYGVQDSETGSSISGIMDINGDGVDDIVIGANQASANVGAVYILYGQNGSNTTTGPKAANVTTGAANSIANTTNITNITSPANTTNTIAASISSPVQQNKTASSSLQSVTTATSIVENTITVIGSSLSFGSSVAVRAGFVSKLIQDIRFLNISYSPEIISILQVQTLFLLDAKLSANIQQQIVSKALPSIYTQYGIRADFLSNIWGRLVAWTSIFGLWVICAGPVRYIKTDNRSRISLLCRVLSVLSNHVLDLLIIQVYGDFNYIILFMVLEIQYGSIESTWSALSLLCAILFLIAGLSLLGLHLWFLITHYKIKSRRSLDSENKAKAFMKRFESLLVLYKDYSDVNAFKHGFLLIQAVRNIIISIMLTNGLSFPSLEAVVLVCLSVSICIYLLAQNPFRSNFDLISQLFLEVCVLVVYLCALLMAISEAQQQQLSVNQYRVERTIIAINFILKSACVLLIGAEILKVVWQAYQERKNTRKKTRESAVVNLSALAENSPSQIHIQPDMNDSSMDISSSHIQLVKIGDNYNKKSDMGGGSETSLGVTKLLSNPLDPLAINDSDLLNKEKGFLPVSDGKNALEGAKSDINETPIDMKESSSAYRFVRKGTSISLKEALGFPIKRRGQTMRSFIPLEHTSSLKVFPETQIPTLGPVPEPPLKRINNTKDE